MGRGRFLSRTTAAGGAAIAAGPLTATAVNTRTATAAPRRSGPLRVHIALFDARDGLDRLLLVARHPRMAWSSLPGHGEHHARAVRTATCDTPGEQTW
ncbi:hypothetical protein Strvi_5423 [Streptomyces violaceusniger Tu 4113]|uniref:Uncharacterized protein n=1 Tax=Streptomyces violaceusniger (strain Tu 4113) TaxID=653045 RepID=G2P419_STRV4|nr:hypothetical protein Strvi_5423 [Streptomyces violaceusniger Tu 4113]